MFYNILGIIYQRTDKFYDNIQAVLCWLTLYETPLYNTEAPNYTEKERLTFLANASDLSIKCNF